MTDTTLFIPGPAGQIEATIAEPLTPAQNICGIICHPHPLFGGTMTNKVVTTVSRAFQNLGITAIRFNFRGVGKSEGEYDEGKGELNDLLSVIAWVKTHYPNQAIYLAGFSFGAYIATLAATQMEVRALVAIAPPVINFPMDTIPDITCPWILIQGEQDEIVSAKAVITWGESRNPKPTLLSFPNAGHFFHGQLGELRMGIEEAMINIC